MWAIRTLNNVELWHTQIRFPVSVEKYPNPLEYLYLVDDGSAKTHSQQQKVHEFLHVGPMIDIGNHKYGTVMLYAKKKHHILSSMTKILRKFSDGQLQAFMTTTKDTSLF